METFEESVSEKKRKKRVHSIGIPLKGISTPVFSGDYFKVSVAELRYSPGFMLYNTSSSMTRSSYSYQLHALLNPATRTLKV